jgi:hypothetical protein
MSTVVIVDVQNLELAELPLRRRFTVLTASSAGSALSLARRSIITS